MDDHENARVRAIRSGAQTSATTIIGVDAVPKRLAVAKAMGADHMIDFTAGDVVEQIIELTDGRGVDVAIEALGTQGTFENALRVLRPGATLSSLRVYSTDLRIPLNAFAAGLGDNKIVTTLCPGGKERMRRLMAVVESWPGRSEAAGYAPLQTGRNRSGLRTVRASTRGRVEGSDHAVGPPRTFRNRGEAAASPPPQCESSAGISVRASVSRVTPPKINSRKREWP